MTATSTLSKYLSGSENAIFCTSAMASKWLRFIFQLPAISGLRLIVVLRSGTTAQYCQAGQRLALKVFQRCPATGGNMREAVLRQAQRAHRSGRVAAADRAERALGRRSGNHLGETLGACGERRELEDPHRTVPEDGLRVTQQLGEPDNRPRADVQ